MVVAPVAPGLSRPEQLVAAGVLVSNVSLVIAAVALQRLSSVALCRPRRLGTMAAVMLLASPGTIFNATVYTESLFTALRCTFGVAA